MAVIPRMHDPTHNDKCSIGLASAMFNISDAHFVAKYIRSGRVPIDRLHQVSWRRVLKIYIQERDKQKREFFKKNPRSFTP